MHDNDENERLLDVREVEEPRRFLSGLDSQRSASDRWGMSDTGSVIDLALADENDPIETQPDNSKKRWRSDTMVDRDTYLMGKKKREESLEKVFTEDSSQVQPPADEQVVLSEEPAAMAEPHILDITAPAPTEPHIPTSDVSAEEPDKPEPTSVAQPQKEEELMKPPIVVPSQARLILEPEPADPILEEPPVAIPVSVLEPELVPDQSTQPEAKEEPPAPPTEIPVEVQEEEKIPEAAAEEEPAPSADITASEEDEPVPVSRSEETVDEVLDAFKDEPHVADEEPPVREEDVTEAKVEDTAEESVPAGEKVPPSPPAEKIEAATTEAEPEAAVEKEQVAEESDKDEDVEPATNPTELSEPVTTES